MKYSPLPLSRIHDRTKTVAKQALLSADPIANHRFFIDHLNAILWSLN
jgi:hypothetical protein